jgi:hypothetical protein
MDRHLFPGDIWRQKSGDRFELYRVIRSCWAQTLVRGTDFVAGRIQPAGSRMLEGDNAPADWVLLRRDKLFAANEVVIPFSRHA